MKRCSTYIETSAAAYQSLLCLNVQDKTVSVFETTIRVLGGLLSAHLIASDYATVIINIESAHGTQTFSIAHCF